MSSAATTLSQHSKKDQYDVPYSAEINRLNPAYFVFLVDQSGSMDEPQAGTEGMSKAKSVSDAINRILQGVIERCSKNDEVRRYFAVSVIGYGQRAAPALTGELAGKPLVWVDELDISGCCEERVESYPDGRGGLLKLPVNFPVWFSPVASGATAMCAALNVAGELVRNWIVRAPNSFPPIVMNMTDGEATDGDPTAAARRLTSQATNDGAVLLFNLHLSSFDGLAQVFPTNDRALVDDYARMLFAISSALPEPMVKSAVGLQLPAKPGSRGFVFNADMAAVVQFLELGTTPANFIALPRAGSRAAIDLTR